MPAEDTSNAYPHSMVVPARVNPLRALIVEDDPLVARSLTRWLKHHGVSVAVALRPSDVAALGTDFDFGIFDIELPEQPGTELARSCLERGIVRRAVFFSGCKDPSLREIALSLGDFVEKGEDVARLGERVLSAYQPQAPKSTLLAVG